MKLADRALEKKMLKTNLIYMTQEKLEIYAIIELFGHNRMAGKVTEQNIAGANMVRVDVPETKLQPAFTRFLNPTAIYAINPVTKEVAEAYADRINTKPIEVWDAREVLNRIDTQAKLNAATHSSVEREEEEEEEEEGDGRFGG